MPRLNRSVALLGITLGLALTATTASAQNSIMISRGSFAVVEKADFGSIGGLRASTDDLHTIALTGGLSITF